MAAYTDNHHSYCNHLSLSSGLTSATQQHNQEISISELVDHGSISFGRFAAESLAWEKWSVFSHNRCQEELEKFKAPGLVAQKKAFFEEYYKKIRAMKKLQAEKQESNKSELCQDEKNITHVEKGAELTKPEEEKNSNDAIQTYSSEKETIAYEDSLGETTEDKSLVAEEQGQNCNNDIINRDEIKASPATIVDKADRVPASPIKTFLKASQQDGCVSSTVKLNANRPRDRTPLPKAKGTVTSARDKTKLDYRTKKDTIKPPEKQKPSIDKGKSGKSTTSQGLTERANSKMARSTKSENVSYHRPSTKARSSATLSQTSVLKDRPTSSSSVRSGVPKANLNSKGSMNKMQTTSRPKTLTNGVDNVVPGKRGHAGVVGKSLEPSSCFMMPKRGQPENQKPKIGLTNSPARLNSPARIKSKQNLANESGLKNDSKGGNRTKILPWQSADLTHARREPRPKTPSWR